MGSAEPPTGAASAEPTIASVEIPMASADPPKASAEPSVGSAGPPTGSRSAIAAATREQAGVTAEAAGPGGARQHPTQRMHKERTGVSRVQDPKRSPWRPERSPRRSAMPAEKSAMKEAPVDVSQSRCRWRSFGPGCKHGAHERMKLRRRRCRSRFRPRLPARQARARFCAPRIQCVQMFRGDRRADTACRPTNVLFDLPLRAAPTWQRERAAAAGWRPLT